MLPSSFHSIGADRWLTAAEAGTWNPHPLTAAMWDVYANQFQCFTGATLDPQFHRLAHPATQTGAIYLEPGAGVAVVGTGPSLQSHIEALSRIRQHVRIVTSPRGAEALVPHGIIPDLVLVEHQTALDAHHSARRAADIDASVLPLCPLVAADWRTPAAIVSGVAPRSLFVPAPLPTWGLWPATAVALAMNAGAARVSLLGIDLGTAQRPDPAHAPLASLLELLARLGRTVTIDCGSGGAAKAGWITGSIDSAAGVRVKRPLATHFRPAPAVAERLADADAALTSLAPIVERARAMCALATDARNRTAVSTAAMERAAAEMMAWRDEARVRLVVQETLGAAFLPRLWRLGVAPTLGDALWRPLLLATHELVAQADALAGAVAVTKAA